jgi:probable rRNA maturation factor
VAVKKNSVDLRNFTRRSAPVFPYKEIAHAILPGWDISLVFAGETRARNLNIALRNKSYIPNVLSYESGKRSGEIIICLPIAQRQSSSYGVSYRHFVVFLFIHGLLHLKGLPHGTTMERHERTFLKRFTGASVSYATDDLNHGISQDRNGH